MHIRLGGLTLVRAEMVRIRLLQRAGDETAFGALVSAVGRGLSMRPTTQRSPPFLVNSCGVMFAFGCCFSRSNFFSQKFTTLNSGAAKS